MTTHEAALLGPQKDTTTLWAAATFMFLEMPSTPPRPTSWWQQQRLAVLTQRAGLLFLCIFREIGPLLPGGGANLRTFAMLGGGV